MKKRTILKRNIITIGIGAILLLGIATAIIVTPPTSEDDGVYFTAGNVFYTMNQSIDFNVAISDDYVGFNGTDIIASSPNYLNISIDYIGDILNAGNGERVFQFLGNTTSGNVYFNMSGFKTGTNYSINRTFQGAPGDIQYSVANASGYISWSNSVWSALGPQTFSFWVEHTTDVGDVTLQLSHNQRHNSDWLNFTTNISDVTSVYINITDAFGTSTNESITVNNSGSLYWKNNSMGWRGNGSYSVFVYASNATTSNVSSSVSFFVYPPTDVNMNNWTTVADITAITDGGVWGTSGPARWVVEDVNGNGWVTVTDITAVTAPGWWGWSGST